MTSKIVGTLLLLGLAGTRAPADTPAAAQARSTRNAPQFVGQTVTVCGRTAATTCTTARDVSLIELENPTFPADIAIGFSSAKRALFGHRFEERYHAADVCATGRVEQIQGKYVLLVESPDDMHRTDGLPLTAEIFAPDAVSTCDPLVVMPKATEQSRPQYTRDAMAARIQGIVRVEAEVLQTGTVGDVRVIRSLDPQYGLDDRGVAAAKQWQFTPATRDGQPVPVVVTIEFSFRLK